MQAGQKSGMPANIVEWPQLELGLSKGKMHSVAVREPHITKFAPEFCDQFNIDGKSVDHAAFSA